MNEQKQSMARFGAVNDAAETARKAEAYDELVALAEMRKRDHDALTARIAELEAERDAASDPLQRLAYRAGVEAAAKIVDFEAMTSDKLSVENLERLAWGTIAKLERVTAARIRAELLEAK